MNAVVGAWPTALHRRVGADRHATLSSYADNCQVYLSTSAEDVPPAVSKFVACVADINAWLFACMTSAERGEDKADVARLESVVGQSQPP